MSQGLNPVDIVKSIFMGGFMKLSELSYSKGDAALQVRLNSMFESLGAEFDKTKAGIEITVEDIVVDGFFPYYSNQACRVLFIGRESLGLSGCNYIDELHYCYTQDYAVGEKSLNQHRFHALMLYLAYGLNHGCPDWETIPMATEIAKTFATDKGVSFAFMNYSKFSNDSGNWKADWSLIERYVDALKGASINFFAKQIEILQPDIILTMNLGNRLKKFGDLTALDSSHCADFYRLNINSKPYLLIDLYHFSAIKNMKDNYYTPVINGIRLYGV